jgi:hypothetical protein
MEITQQRLLHVTHSKAVIHRALQSRDRIMEWNADTQSSREIWSAPRKKQIVLTSLSVCWDLKGELSWIDVTKGGEMMPEVDQSAYVYAGSLTPGVSLLASVFHRLSSSPKMFSFSAPSAKPDVNLENVPSQKRTDFTGIS